MTRRAIVLIIPSALTLARLGAVPVTVWLILDGAAGVAFWVFVAAGVTDALDGALARWLDARTVIGGYLDAIADKALLVSVYVTLAAVGLLPAWIVILVVFRDLLIVGAVLLFHTLGQPTAVAPLIIGKLNTLAQILLAGLVLGMVALGVPDSGFARAMTWLVAATTVASGGAYLVRAGRRLGGVEAA